jgi:hypothetical protein
VRPGECRGGGVDDRHEDQADRVGSDAGHLAELAVRDDRPRRVAHRGRQHLGIGQQVATASTGPGEQRDTGESQR